jgi:hypothetical protein
MVIDRARLRTERGAERDRTGQCFPRRLTKLRLSVCFVATTSPAWGPSSLPSLLLLLLVPPSPSPLPPLPEPPSPSPLPPLPEPLPPPPSGRYTVSTASPEVLWCWARL